MKTNMNKIIIPLIAAIGIFVLSGCGGGGPGKKEVSEVVTARITSIKNSSSGKEADMLQAMVGVPVDIKTDKIVDSWDITIISQGNSMKNSGVKKESVGIAGHSVDTVGINDIPLGVKLYPVIYQMISKDKQHEGIPQEKYFYKDAHEKWDGVLPENVGVEDSKTYQSIVGEYLKKQEEKIKALNEMPYGVVKQWLECLKERWIEKSDTKMYALQFVSQDYKNDFLTQIMGGPLALEDKSNYIHLIASSLEPSAFKAILKEIVANVMRTRHMALGEAAKKIEITDEKTTNESAEVTLSGNMTVGLKKIDGKWLITKAPQFLKEGVFNKDDGIPQCLYECLQAEFVGAFEDRLPMMGLGKGDSPENTESMAFDEKGLEATKTRLSEYLTLEYQNVIITKIFGDTTGEKLKNADFYKKRFMEDQAKEYVHSLTVDGASTERIDNETAKLGLQSGGIVSLKKVDGR